uniref:Uncharacterized protein n=1 Tax=Aegilops tauschii subsp. strangulata TaxID=200361 RepID=A0A453DBM3_AEGTS
MQAQGSPEEDAEERDEERRTDGRKGWGQGRSLVCQPPPGLAGIGRHAWWRWRWRWRRGVAGGERDCKRGDEGRLACESKDRRVHTFLFFPFDTVGLTWLLDLANLLCPRGCSQGASLR